MVPDCASQGLVVWIGDFADHQLFGTIWIVGVSVELHDILELTERGPDHPLGGCSRYVQLTRIPAESNGDNPFPIGVWDITRTRVSDTGIRHCAGEARLPLSS